MERIFTGLFNQDGEPIFKNPNPIGFVGNKQAKEPIKDTESKLTNERPE